MESAKPIRKIPYWPKHISRRFALTESSKAPVKQAAAILVFAMLLAPALALILTSQSEIAEASPDSEWWDSDWAYRKEITIDSTKVENLENYEVTGVLQNLGEIDVSWTEMLQGVTTDGTYVYVIASSKVTDTMLVKYYENGDEVENENINGVIPYSSDLTYRASDNYLYIIKVENTDNGVGSWTSVFKYSTDLEYVENWNLENETYGRHPQGICWYDNYWWINTYFPAPPIIFKLDNSWTSIENYTLTDVGDPRYQGHAFWEKYGHVFYGAVSNQNKKLSIFEYVGNSFVLRENIAFSAAEEYMEQGMDVENIEGGTAWFCDRTHETIIKSNVENLIKWSSENYDNFPVLISWSSDSDLAAHTLDNGDDIAFVTVDNTQLDHEIENFVGDNGQLIAWVRIPTLVDNENTIFYMYYGNASASNQENPTGVWDDNFKGVWHLKEDPSSENMQDSTSNNEDAVPYGSMTSGDQVVGKISGSLDFDGGDDYIDPTISLSASSTLTLSCWVKTTATDDQMFFGGDVPANGYQWYVRTAIDGDDIYLAVKEGAGWESVTYVQPDVNDGNDHHFAITFDGGFNLWKIYWDGDYTNTSLTQDHTTGTNIIIASLFDGYTEPWGGNMDEVRYSNSVRSAGWIKTSYNNQNSPSTFYSVGAEETAEEWGLIETWTGTIEAYVDTNTFGYTEIGTVGAQDIYDRITGSWWKVSESGTVNSISVHFDTCAASNVKCAIYENQSGTWTFIDNTEIKLGLEVFDDWETFDFENGSSLTLGNDYLLAVWADGQETCTVDYDTESGRGRYLDNTWGSWPATLSPTSEDRKYSIYVDYTRAAVPPEKPVLTSPENNYSTFDNTPTFVWENGAYTNNNRIEVDDDSDFSSCVDNVIVMDNTWTKPSPGYPLGTYYWRVWAINAHGENCSENTWKFTITLDKPTLISPENDTTTDDNTPTFIWQVGVNADNHRIEVDDNSDFSSPIDNVVLGSTDNTWTKTGEGYPENSTYYWRVWTINAQAENCSENTWIFHVQVPPIISIDWAGSEADNWVNWIHATENEMTVKVSVTDANEIENVLLEWYDNGSWENFEMDNTGEDNYLKNMTGLENERDYSFNVWAKDIFNNWTKVEWLRKIPDNQTTRKYVRANYVPGNLNYKQFYLWEGPEWTSADLDERCFNHEQGPDAGLTDTGYGYYSAPVEVQSRTCATFLGWYLDENITIPTGTVIDNIYIHFWWTTDDENVVDFWRSKSPTPPNPIFCPYYFSSAAEAEENVEIDGKTYYLEIKFWEFASLSFNSNDVYQFIFGIHATGVNPTWTCVAGRPSFIILNLPDDSALQVMDSDGDGVSDYDELFTYFTDPLYTFEIENIYVPEQVKVGESFDVDIEIFNSADLDDVEEVWLKVFDNDLNEENVDNILNHYTFKWVRDGADNWFEVGPDNTSPYDHLIVENCSAGQDNLTEDNWTFNIQLSADVNLGLWSVWAKTTDNLGHVENKEIANRFEFVIGIWNIIETWTGTLDTFTEWDLIENWTGSIEAHVEWHEIEQWSGTIKAPAAWQLIEEWSGTVKAPVSWVLLETWSGTVSAPAAWQLIETWTGTIEAFAQWELAETWTGSIEAPIAWILIENWSGTVQAPAAWNLIENWAGTIEAPANWNLTETWTGTIIAPIEWNLIEQWSGTVEAFSGWQLLETWTGAIEAPAQWQLIETWNGTVQTPSVPVWNLMETWTGTIEAPAAWVLIETWIGSLQAPTAWNLIETWEGTITAPSAWSLIETWDGTVEAYSGWVLIETWSGSVQAPSEWSEVENWTGTIYAVGWRLVETWTGTIETHGWSLIETWTGSIETPAVYAVSISITPAENSGTLGDTLTYTVIVINLGGQTDNYDLASSDALGWVTYLDNDNFASVPSGENRTTTLNVALSTIGTHEVIVTATGTGVSDSDNCTAISATAPDVIQIGDGNLGLAIGLLAIALALCAPFIAVILIRKRREEEGTT